MSDDKAAAEAPKKKSGLVKKLVLFGVLPLVLIGGGVGAGLYAAGGSGGHKEDPHRPKLVLKEGQSGPTDLPDGTRINPEVYKSTYYPMEQPFTSNLRDTDGFLQMGLGVSTFYDEKVVKHLEESDMPVRSAVLEVLASSDASALDTPEGKLALRKRLKDVINHVLQHREGFGGVDDVYFTSFIIQ
ncbi:flagellar basal body-associated FliL family protein [uncultured Sphingomonas sp.]|uniref:flagellar basal body-associated FliL family protein n=1 Tax=uncultured Sphingomonas sp. TaxID=158754 RepID=UPI0025CF44EF|nr:flagellar basal body-associated FliL family protein [uncultured Sphingomonas sp.]